MAEAAKTNVVQGPFGLVRALSSAIMNRVAWASQAGLTFNGKRDLNVVLGYPTDLKPIDYRAKYHRGGVAARIVEIIAESTWRGGAAVIESPDPEVTTAFEKEYALLARRLKIYGVMTKADKLAGLGRYATILIGTRGALNEAVRSVSSEDIVYLRPYGEEELKVWEVEDSERSPRFGQPLFYKLKVNTVKGGQTKSTVEKVVHYSRVIHIADNTLDDEIYGLPRLERVWNLLCDLEKVTGGGAEAFWLRANQGTQFDLDPEIELSEANEQKLKDEVEEFSNQIRRYIRTRGVEIKTLGSDVADFAMPADAILTQIAAAIGIPKRILLGSERGDLASSQDKGHWDDFVADRRTRFAGPNALEPLINRLQGWGALPAAEYSIDWPQIKNLDEKGRADVANILSKLNKQANGLVITPEEIRDAVLLLPKLTDQQRSKYMEALEEEVKRQQALKAPREERIDPDDPEERPDRQEGA